MVVIIGFVDQQFENYVVQPRVFKKAVDVPGVLVVMAALVGGALLGITGALLAVPVAAVALLILRDVAQPKLDASCERSSESRSESAASRRLKSLQATGTR